MGNTLQADRIVGAYPNCSTGAAAMSKPRSVKILGKKIPVTFVDKLQDGDLGSFESHPARITILDDESWREHLLHECLHAALFVSGLNELLDHKTEEAIVRAMEHMLTEFKPDW